MSFDFTPITVFQVEGELSKETRSSMFEAEGKFCFAEASESLTARKNRRGTLL